MHPKNARTLFRRGAAFLAIALFAFALPVAPAAQEQQSVDAAQPAEAAAVQASTSDPEAVICHVGTHAITEGDLEARFLQEITRRTGGRPVPPAQLDSLRGRFRQPLIEELVKAQLLRIDAANAGVVVGDKEVREFYLKTLPGTLIANGMTQADLEQSLTARGMTFEEFLEQQMSNPMLRDAVLQTRLLVKRYPAETKVTPEDVAQRYERDKAQVYTQEENVRASHILLGTEGKDGAGKAEVRAQLEGILADCKKDGADFGTLAKQHSSCPSAAQGGDLGAFPRTGKMVEPFAKAAFELQVGEISGVVETQFGFHIIKVTDRMPAKVFGLEEVSASIHDELLFEKITPLRETHLTKLRETVKVEFTGSDPAGEQGADVKNG